MRLIKIITELLPLLMVLIRAIDEYAADRKGSEKAEIAQQAMAVAIESVKLTQGE